MQKMRTRLCRLQDKRLLEYAEFGDPNGMPVMFFHGFMGSCQQAVLANANALEEGVRIIAPNRPGIGRSSPATFKTMTEYASDIRQLADKLGIRRFAVIGTSAGGCFALACGQSLPRRVRLVGVVGGIGPLNVMHNLQQMTLFRRTFLRGCHGYPSVARYGIAAFFLFCKHWPRLSYSWLIKTSSVIDVQMMSRKDLTQALWWDHQNVFLQKNGIEGMLLETRLYFHWGFDLKNFPKKTRVIFWHGKEDPILPWSVIREMAEPIARSEGILYSGGHLTFLMNRTDVVLKRMKHEWRKTEPTFTAPRSFGTTGLQMRDFISGAVPSARSA